MSLKKRERSTVPRRKSSGASSSEAASGRPSAPPSTTGFWSLASQSRTSNEETEVTASAPAPRTRIFAAGLVVPVSAPSIRDGALLVENGRIAAIGPLRDIGRDNTGIE